MTHITLATQYMDTRRLFGKEGSGEKKMFLGIFLFFLFCEPEVLCQVITSIRSQPYPLYADQTVSCCSYLEDSEKLMNCLRELNYEINTDAAIVTYVTKGIYDYASYALAINSVYAEHNRYEFKILTPSEANYEPSDARWNKVKILEEAIDNNGWAHNKKYVVWIDADLAILDLGMRIELIGQEYPDADIILSEDLDAAATLGNSGYILVRNTPWAKTFLSMWWSHEDRSRMSDQSSLTLLFHTLDSQQQAKIKILRKDAINSHFPPHINQKEYNQVLHLAGDIQAYRRLVFRKGFQEICTSLSFEPMKPIPNQLSLSREYLASSTESMKGVRITELQQLLSTINKYALDNVVSAYTHYSFIDSILNRVLDLQKGVYEEFINVPTPVDAHEAQKLSQLKFEFYTLEIDILYWCYSSYKKVALYVNSSIPYMSQETSSPEILNINYHHAESLRQTMSIAYFLVDFHATYSRNCLLESAVSEKQKVTQTLKDVLHELEYKILPELQRRLPPSDLHRSKYYQFKLYQFITGILSLDNGETEQLLHFYKKAVNIWRELHQMKYYGTTYVTVDPYKEGSRTIKYLGGLLCYESIGTHEEGISYYREAQSLMEQTLQGFEGNHLAHDGVRIEELIALSRLHAEVGSCLVDRALLIKEGVQDYLKSLDYIDKARKFYPNHELPPDVQQLENQVKALYSQFFSRMSSRSTNEEKKATKVEQQVDPTHGESNDMNTHQQSKSKRLYRRKKKNFN